MKKSLLIVYSKMIIGGSTTSLLSLLNEIDYDKYDVDLLLMEKGGVLDAKIPEKVNILDNNFLHIKKKPLSYKAIFLGTYVKSKLCKNHLIRSQVMSRQLAKIQPGLEKKYDAAIAYLEFWPSNYVHQKINAKKKILWVHCDYKGTGLTPKHDRQMYSDVDTVVTVSDACRSNFKGLFPTAKSVVTAHNLLSVKSVSALADTFTPDAELYGAEVVFVTVARIDFAAKGYDRGVMAFQKMKQLHPDKNFKWLIIGDGPDRGRLEDLIRNAGLDNEILLLGAKTNPHPYIKKADVFFLPSRYEGKPMAVTEAQMNGVVPFVTNYASATDQISHMQDGLICDNSDEAIVQMMDKLLSGDIDLSKMKQEISQKDYSNHEEINKIYDLLNA